MLAQPAQSLTDLALGVVVVALAVRLARVPTANRHWFRAFGWAGIAALAGAFHHAVASAARSPRLTTAIADARGQLFLPTDSLVYPPDVAKTMHDHSRIAAALRRKDHEAAATAMIEHIESTRAWLRGILTRPSAAPSGESATPRHG